MGIDIYSKWRGQTKDESEAQSTGFDITQGRVGYLREAYHGGPYVTHYLLREAFQSEDGTAKIPASVLRERLPRAVVLAMFRYGKVYGRGAAPHEVKLGGTEDAAAAVDEMLRRAAESAADRSALDIAEKMDDETVRHARFMIGNGLIPDYARSFVDFVELCERKESETGEPVEVLASY